MSINSFSLGLRSNTTRLNVNVFGGTFDFTPSYFGSHDAKEMKGFIDSFSIFFSTEAGHLYGEIPTCAIFTIFHDFADKGDGGALWVEEQITICILSRISFAPIYIS